MQFVILAIFIHTNYQVKNTNENIMSLYKTQEVQGRLWINRKKQDTVYSR